MPVALYVTLALLLIFSGCSRPKETFTPLDPSVPVSVSDGEKQSYTKNEPAADQLPQLAADSNLSDYLAYAALNNAGLKSRFYDWQAAVQQVPQARALPDPMLEYAYFIKEVETRVGPQNHRLSLMQKFPWFGVIEARTDIASKRAKAMYQQYLQARLELSRQVTDAYAEYVYLRRAIQIAAENVQFLEHFEQVARTKYETAAATHPDVIRAQVELAKLQDTLESLRELRKPLSQRLSAVLNRKEEGTLSWPRPPEPSDFELDPKRLSTILRSKNPELGAIEQRIEAAKSGVKLADAKGYPDIGIGVGWIETGRAVNPGVSDSGTDPIMLMFSMNIPLWQDSYAAAQSQAKSELTSQRQMRIQTENELIASLEKAVYGFEDSKRKVRLYGDVLKPKARQLLRASETAYQGGQVDFLSLIDAERMLLRYELEYERAVTDNIQRLAELQMLTGQQLTGDNQ